MMWDCMAGDMAVEYALDVARYGVDMWQDLALTQGNF
jgi:hypothetical protein